jgi:rubrerythrin
MGIVFNAEEIYQIGVQIEKNGEAFYIAAASAASDPDAKKLFTELAAWEKGHIKLFSDLKSLLPGSLGADDSLDSDDQKSGYLRALAGGHVFIANKDPKSLVAKCSDAASVLKIAIEFEKDSVVVYTAMKNIVPPKLGKDTIDRLINEEIQHVVMLQQRLTVLN